VERRTSAWSDIIDDTSWPSTGVLVAEDHSGTLVGFAHVSGSRDDDAGSEVGEVTSIYISPDVWQQGAGRALLEAASATLQAAGFSSATLWLLDTNDRARKFYERMGWQPDGAVKVDDRGDFALRELRYTTHLA
jgi:GNAT superfamily N-acetyltransferase